LDSSASVAAIPCDDTGGGSPILNSPGLVVSQFDVPDSAFFVANMLGDPENDLSFLDSFEDVDSPFEVPGSTPFIANQLSDFTEPMEDDPVPALWNTNQLPLDVDLQARVPSDRMHAEGKKIADVPPSLTTAQEQRLHKNRLFTTKIRNIPE
jgi:hypothetical protein